MDTVTTQEQRITYTNVSVSMLKQHITIRMSPPQVESRSHHLSHNLYCHKFHFKSLESFGPSYILYHVQNGHFFQLKMLLCVLGVISHKILSPVLHISDKH